jgi:hypothetical protein
MFDPTCVPGAGGMSEEDRRYLKYCKMHGSVVATTVKKQARKLYQIARYRDRIDRISDPEVGVNLDEELAVLRMTLEAALNKYDEIELITMSGQVASLVRDIRETLTCNKKLKSQMGELLDRAAMHRLCDRLVVIISKYISPNQLDSVSIDVAAAVAEAVSQRIEE